MVNFLILTYKFLYKIYIKKKVNFCFECSKYPCRPTTYNKFLTKVWRDNNDYMKKIGVDNFYILEKEKTRY